jgi:nicotinamide-nucleotide amidase
MAAHMSTAELAGAIGTVMQERHQQSAVAESLTGGQLASHLARAAAASEWFRGGLVAYQAEVKQDLLGVKPGPVVTQSTAEQMANGIAALLDADLAIAVTGVGGPDPEEGQPPGTVWMAVRYRDETVTQLLHLEGDPPAVCDQTSWHALSMALQRLRS